MDMQTLFNRRFEMIMRSTSRPITLRSCNKLTKSNTRNVDLVFRAAVQHSINLLKQSGRLSDDFIEVGKGEDSLIHTTWA